MENQSVIDTFIEIDPVNSDDFLKIKETLTRIGIQSERWAQAHIVAKLPHSAQAGSLFRGAFQTNVPVGRQAGSHNCH